METATLSDLGAWKSRLGLIAVPLQNGDESRFVMLNGSRGNFCLDLSGQVESNFARSAAWSSDVGHYVTVTDEQVFVQRWDRSKLDTRPYTLDSVAGNLDEFQRLLEKSDPDRQHSIVGFITRIYGVLRSLIPERLSGAASMKAFLILLACAVDGKDREGLQVADWGLTAEARSTSLRIPEDQWTALLAELLAGRARENLQPLFTLMLRHAAGQVFQDAHYLADFSLDQQMMLTGMLPAPAKHKWRESSQGVFFTPPYLARTIVEQAVSVMDHSRNRIYVFDPACGSGEILREVIRQFEQKAYGGTLTLIGWDVSPIACDMANYVLSWERRAAKNLRIEFRIEQRDSISETQDWPTNLDAVLMNPPFIAYPQLTDTQRLAIAAVLGALKGQRPDMASAFFLNASRHVHSTGVVGAILPSSLLYNDSAMKLREHISSEFSPKLIAKLGDLSLFHNALVDAGIFVGVRGKQVDGTKLWADHTKVAISRALRMLRRFDGAPISEPMFSIYPIDEPIGGSSWAPQPFGPFQLAQSFKSLPRVADLFEVRQGIRTGLNVAFLIDSSNWQNVPRKERKYFRPAIINKSLRNGRIVDPIHLFYAHGDRALDTEPELRAAVPWFFEHYLAPNKPKLQSRAKTDPKKWWKLVWPREREPAPKFISTAFGRRGSWAWDAQGDCLVINGFAWYPKLPHSLGFMPDDVVMAYLAILNSDMIDQLLAVTSRHVGGGQWDLLNRCVDPLPIPNLFSDRLPKAIVADLAAIGMAIYHGVLPDESRYRRAVEAAYEMAADLE